MANVSESAEARALSYLNHPRIHQRFTLPATGDHEALTVTYADVGRTPNPGPNGETVDTPTVLFIPGMFASRYIGVHIHAVAEKWGARVLIIDRPGMGGSTTVPLGQRMAVWLETVPAILAHLSIKHITLASHSAGTIYLLNTLYHSRDILPTTKPVVSLLAPWVDPTHSHVPYMQAARHIPKPIFGFWNRIPEFFHNTVGQPLAASGMVFTSVTNALTPRAAVSGDHEDNTPRGLNRRRLEEVYGVAKDVQKELDRLVFYSTFREDTSGANDEAMFCLKKGGTWGEADDYAEYVRRLVELERKRVDEGVQAGDEARTGKLKVRAYFAESDAMSGKRGQAYVEECWKGGKNDQYQEAIDFQSEVLPGTDHDSIIQSVAALEKVFRDAGGTM